MKDFFISFTGADKGWADWIAYTLHEAGYDFHYQGWHFGPGTNFVAEMQTGAAGTERTLAVLSSKYFESPACTAEWSAAFNRDKDGTKRLLLPVRVEKFAPPGLWSPRVYVDLYGVDEATAKQLLLDAITWQPGPPAARPAFPGTLPATRTAAPPFPGATSATIPKLPPIWNIPHRRNPNFTGREELLGTLYTSLTSDDYAALTQAMHGLGGVGKTQTAIEYAYRYASEYDVVLWVPAEDPMALAGHFAALAGVIGLSVDLADQSAAVAAVQKWLRENSRWLLIFDNSVTAADIQPYLPQTGTGHVIITSRNPEWRRIAKTLPVQRFAPEEATAFLLERVGGDVADPGERTAAATLGEELGGLAIALEQAGAYVETHGMSLADYLCLFREHRERVLLGEPSPDYPHTVETVWTLSFSAVQAASKAAAELLTLVAFFAPDDISVDLIRAGADCFPPALAEAAHNDLQFGETIRVLRQHSLIESARDCISIHRVVQAVARGALSNGERRTWASTAIQSIAAAFPGLLSDVATWPVYGKLAPHVSSAAQHCESAGVALSLSARCLNDLGVYFHNRADYESALVYLERAIALNGESSNDQKSFAVQLGNLGILQNAMGNPRAARATCERALELAEIAFRPNDPSVATIVNNLGAVLQNVGEYSAAQSSFERALRIDEAALGANHPSVARDLNNLGFLHRLLNNLQAAEANYQRALQIDEGAFGPNHPDVAIDLSNLSSVLRAKGDLTAARAALERALRIDEAMLGPDHPNVAIRLNNLAVVLRDLGELNGSRENYERSLKILCKSLGERHPSTEAVRENVRFIELEMDTQ